MNDIENNQRISELITTIARREANKVKIYADVSAFRNVLDMLKVFNGELQEFGNALYSEAVKLSCIKTAPTDAIGYAINIVGSSGTGNRGYGAPVKLVYYTLKNAGFKGLRWEGVGGGCLIFPLPKPVNIHAASGVRDISREINWELNRVRLPTPHNFRQISSKVARTKNFTAATSRPNQFMGVIRGINTPNFINLIELLNTYKQLKEAALILRNAVRKEINVLNIAAQVEEHTLRRETEELISREEAKKQADAREIIINDETVTIIQDEIVDSGEVNAHLNDAHTNLTSDIQQAADNGDAERVAYLSSELDRLDSVINDKNNALSNALRAADNLNTRGANIDTTPATVIELRNKDGGGAVLPIIATIALASILI